MKICVISEHLCEPLDEGFKKFAFALIKNLSARHQVLSISQKGLSQGETVILPARMNRLMFNWKLRRTIRRFDPRVLCYIPSSSGTLNSFLRARILKSHARGARVILFSLQSRSFSPRAARWARRIRPHLILTQSHQTARALQNAGCPSAVLHGGVDTDIFRPVSAEIRSDLRLRYGVEPEDFIVLHVGHINRQRGLKLLDRVQQLPGVRVLLVGSTSTLQDTALREELENSGVSILADYLPRIEEIYQLADCYLFPVSIPTAAIELPLSVLEAMACNLPVITTPYGGVADLFSEGGGLFFATEPGEIAEAVSVVQRGLATHTRELVAPYSWRNVLETFSERYLR